MGEIAILLLLAALLFTVRRGFNQVIAGLQSIDARLAERD